MITRQVSRAVRLVAIVREFEAGAIISTSGLAEKHECSVRQIQRDILAIDVDLRVPIVKVGPKKYALFR